MSDTYWHLFNGVVTDPDMHASSIVETQLGPDDLTETGVPVRDFTMPAGFGTGDLTYAATFDHAPTDEELAAFTPERFQETR